MKLKVCGMKYKDNLEELFELEPDYIGFIFYPKSSRFYDDKNIPFPENIQKVGVFVNASITEVIGLIDLHQLDVVQIHGEESEEYCANLKNCSSTIKIWKAFSVGEDFKMENLSVYNSIDAYLFDTKGSNYGGNGIQFNWGILKNFDLDKEIVLSGGITVLDVAKIKEIQKLVPQIKTVDINSRFEFEPGRKNIELVREFSQQIKEIQ